MKEILRTIKTMDEKEKLLRILDDLSRKIFDPTVDFAGLIDNIAGEKFSDKLKKYFSNEAENLSSESILRKIKDLQKAIYEMPKVTLTTAKDPDESQKEMISSTFIDDDKPAIIDFVKDESLIGGAVIADNGYIFEHSFRDYFEKRRSGKI